MVQPATTNTDSGSSNSSSAAPLHAIDVTDISGDTFALERYQGKALLIVNTASKCGFTPQYEGLEKLYQDYKDRGLMILGFPCNQFGAQEPEGEEAIATFCQRNFGVTFPLFSKIDVNGADAHPLYRLLSQACPGLLGSKAIKWNFTKFLVDPSGKPLKRFAPKDTPESLRQAIEAVLPD